MSLNRKVVIKSAMTASTVLFAEIAAIAAANAGGSDGVIDVIGECNTTSPNECEVSNVPGPGLFALAAIGVVGAIIIARLRKW
jgi:hypothetical protein